MLLIILIAIFGLILGSFLNVVIHRLPEKQSLSTPGSHCPVCGQAVRWFDNVPLLSYLLLGGRCRDCKTRIPMRYPLVELLTGLGFALLYWRYGWTYTFGRYLLLFLFLVPIAFIDWDRKLILNRLTLPCAVVGALYILVFQTAMWTDMLIGGAAGALVLLAIGVLGNLIFKKESLGMGDVKLIGIIGIYAGFPQVLYVLIFAMITATVYILVGLIGKRLEMGRTIPFGPFIAIGALMQFIVGDQILMWYVGLYQ